MSKLFWTYSKLDDRVAPLVFLVRQWAKLYRITTNIRPSSNFTNFQLTVLVLNYLLRLDKSIIVPLDTLSIKNVQSESTDEHGPKLLLKNHDIQTMKNNFLSHNRNETSLNDLFLGFLKYYSTFDFQKNSISLNQTLNLNQKKNKRFTIFMENPFDQELNMAHNVDRQTLKYFNSCCYTTSCVIKSLRDKSTSQYDLIRFFEVIQNKSLSSKNSQDNGLADEMNL